MFESWMFWLSKKISHKKIGEITNYKTYSDVIKTNKKNGVINIIITVLCVFLIGYLWKYIIQAWQIAVWAIAKWTVTIVSKGLWQDMIKDEFGNVNVLIAWFWWWWHAWWYLADSIMVASRNPDLWAVSMVSVPRDLYVNDKEKKIAWRINEVLARWVGRNHEIDTWAKILATKLEEITSLKIPYYALIDFQWFESLIDTLWWITIDVPKTIHDTTYPTEDKWYMTFHVNSWINTMDWKTALMYARSRHSTSDFDRSLRQQQIIKAIMNKLVSSNSLNPSKMKELYADYTKIVKTNISLDEMIGAARYAYNLKHIYSFGYTTECSIMNYKLSRPACFLYTPPQELFWGAAVIIPSWAGPDNISFYDNTRNFAFYVAHNQKYLIENANITVQNGIDKTYAKQLKVKNDGYATKLAVKLKKYAFNVQNVTNATVTGAQTALYILWTWTYTETINMLRSFLAINKVYDIQKDVFPTWVNPSEYTWWTELLIILWNTFLDQVNWKSFNYYK